MNELFLEKIPCIIPDDIDNMKNYFKILLRTNTKSDLMDDCLE